MKLLMDMPFGDLGRKITENDKKGWKNRKMRENEVIIRTPFVHFNYVFIIMNCGGCSTNIDILYVNELLLRH